MEKLYTTKTSIQTFLRGGVVLFLLFSQLSMKAQPYLNEQSRKQFICDPLYVLEIYGLDLDSDVAISEESGLSGNLVINGFGNAGTHIQVDVDPPGDILDGAKYGRVVLQITNPGMEVYFDTVYFLPCCDGSSNLPSPANVIIWETTSSLNSRGISEFDNDQYWIMEVMTVDLNFEIKNNADVRMQWDSKIILEPSFSLEIINSTLSALCGSRWDGILADAPTNFILADNSEIMHAARGIMVSNDVMLDLGSNIFTDNLISLGLIDYTSSTVSLVDNQFIWPASNRLLDPSSTIDMSVYPPFSTTTTDITCQIIAINSNGIEIGDIGGSLNFIEATGVIYYRSSSIGIGSYDTQADIYAFEITLFGEGILSEISTLDMSLMKFVNSHYSLKAFGSKIDFYDSELDESPFYIEFDGTIGVQGFSFTNNFHWGNNSKVYGDGTASCDVVIANNIEFLDAFIELKDLLSPSTLSSPSADEGVIVRNNNFDNTNVAVWDCPYARVGMNQFENTNSAANAVGLFLRNCEGAQIKDNHFEDLDIGMIGEGDLTDAVFSCNNLVNNNICWQFNGGTLLSPQGSATAGVDNVFSGCNTEVATPGNIPNGPHNYFQQISGLVSGGQAFSVQLPNATATIANCQTFTKAHTSDMENNLIYRIYPNPSDGEIRIDGNTAVIAILIVSDVYGNKLKEFHSESDFNILKLDLSPGLYFAQIIEKQTHKVHIERVLIK